MAIFDALLPSTKEREIERLLTRALPMRYLELSVVEIRVESEVPSIVRGLRRAFRMAFDATTDDVRRRESANYARVLREEAGFDVFVHETAGEGYRLHDCRRCSSRKNAPIVTVRLH